MLNPRFYYTLLLWLLLPYALFHLVWRARKQPEYLQHIGERFGHYTLPKNSKTIWIHTVSVGETRAAVTLIQALQQHYPQHQILLTHTTPTGRETSTQLFGDNVWRVYLPYDYPFAVKKFLHHFRPEIGILLETEIWFNLIHQCHLRHIPLLLLNARLSEKSAQRYARWPSLMRQGLQQLHTLSAQTPKDAQRLATLGAENISIMGNLKFDITPPDKMRELGVQLRQLFGAQRTIFLAASTREGEEALLLTALKKITIPNLLTVIVPRHPQRFDEVAELIQQHQFHLQRRSENLPISPDTHILLGDSMGEMFAYYAACDITFIGGSLLPFGSQNLIEACALGKPVLIGPHTYNFAQAAEQAIEQGAAICIANASELMQTLQSLIHNPTQQAAMGQAGIRFVQENQGATTRALAHITQALPQQ